MAPNDTLNEMAQLNKSKFGKPHPRHGLKLLHWFARDCINFHNDPPVLKCNPWDGDFGFHVFRNDDKLLPFKDNPYYVVGNLHSKNALRLPQYVREDYFGAHDNSNADRIIICLGSNHRLDWIYVTRHHDQRSFDQNHTYRISKGLLKIISNFSDHNEFLKEVGYVGDQESAESRITIYDDEPPNHSVPVTRQSHASVQISAETHIPQRCSLWNSCNIL